MNREKYGLMMASLMLVTLVVSLCVVPIVWGLTPHQIAQKSFPSVVLLVMEDSNGQPLSIGSGFFVKSNIVATNFHVIEGASGGHAKIVGEKRKYEISGTVGIDRNIDLVLLSIEGAKAPPLQLGVSEQVQIGDEIYAIGNPLGLEGTFSKGIVSGIRNIGSEKIFQLTAPISPGSSGGPILNNRGKVIGVAVSTVKGGQNLNFSIPSYYLDSLLSKSTSIKALSKKITSKGQKSVFSSIGKRGLDGVVARKFTWQNGGKFSFSLYNKLRTPIWGVECIIIFCDKAGYPIDIKTESSYEYAISLDALISGRPGKGYVKRIIIPPGLARMKYGHTSSATKKLTDKVEIRVLDFKITDPN